MSRPKFLADENFESAILRGLRRRSAEIDIIRVQEQGLSGTDDRIILDWAAEHNRVVLTHDLRTMPAFAYERVGENREMPGLIAMRPDIHIGTAIDDILLIVECLTPDELAGAVLRLPL